MTTPHIPTPPLTWLDAHDPFPPVEQAWDFNSPMPGLLAAGGVVDAAHLKDAYSQGIFPWFSPGQPNLWWSPDPRMVLQPCNFRVQPSLRKTLRQFIRRPGYEIRIDTSFREVITQCARTPRTGQDGTWIVPSIIDAYCQLHAQGLAHSVETWVGDRLVGGLYCVALGHAVYGESMFSHATDASKIALSALVALCRYQGVPQIDCQQATAHLASLGAQEQSRATFLATAAAEQQLPPLNWCFKPIYWSSLSLGLSFA